MNLKFNKQKIKYIIRFIIQLIKIIFLLIPNFVGQYRRKISYEIDKKRLLMVYDLTSQPFSIGDILVMQEAAIVKLKELELKKCDFAVLFNPSKPATGNSAFKKLDIESGLFHLASILPVAQINKYLGSVFSFDSRCQLEKHLKDNNDRLEVWPNNWKLNYTGEYLYYTIFQEILIPFYIKNGYLPSLQSRKPLEEWAFNFFKENSDGMIPITVNIRNNQLIDKHRNSNINEWLNFFSKNKKKYPVKFFILCSRSELDERLRKLSNVVIVKDFYSTVEQDLALIEASAIHMGTSSGPATMAWFNKNPYFIVNATLHLEHFSIDNLLVNVSPNLYQFVFSNPGQFFYSGNESLEILEKYFEEMWSHVKLNYYDSNRYNITPISLNWLR